MRREIGVAIVVAIGFGWATQLGASATEFYLQEATGGVYPLAERDPPLMARLANEKPSLDRIPKGLDTHLYEYPNLISGNTTLKDFTKQPRDIGPICQIPYHPLAETLGCLAKLETYAETGIEAAIRSLHAEAGKAGVDVAALLSRIDSSAVGWNARGAAEIAKVECKDLPAERASACRSLKGNLAAYLAITDLWVRGQVIEAALWEAHRLPDGLIVDPEPAPPDALPYFIHHGPDDPTGGGNEGASSHDFPLHACASAYQLRPAQERMLPAENVCRITEGSDLAYFNQELASFFVDSSAYDYLRILRMEAAARVLKGYRDATGNQLETVPLACSPFEKGLAAVRAAPPSAEAMHNREVFGSPELRGRYLRELRMAAEEIQGAQDEARQLGNVPAKICEVSDVDVRMKPECKPNPAYKMAQAGIRLQTALIIKKYQAHPILAQGGGTLEHVTESSTLANQIAAATDENQVLALFLAAQAKMKSEAEMVLNRVCTSNPEAGGLVWEELVGLHSLVAPVLTRFPQFRFVQWCAEYLIARDEDFKARTKGMMTLSCLTTMLSPAVFVWANPICSITFTALAFKDKKSAEKHLTRMAESQRMGIN
ncbi:MAG: hypothetical protein AAB425_02715, partial [Bdellovibrionota bacterium]